MNLLTNSPAITFFNPSFELLFCFIFTLFENSFCFLHHLNNKTLRIRINTHNFSIIIFTFFFAMIDFYIC